MDVHGLDVTSYAYERSMIVSHKSRAYQKAFPNKVDVSPERLRELADARRAKIRAIVKEYSRQCRLEEEEARNDYF